LKERVLGLVVVLEFLRTNDREEKVDDQEKGDNTYNVVGHGVLVGFRGLDFLADPYE
jgi:hypothetical protein